jgi:hypothetical protein
MDYDLRAAAIDRRELEVPFRVVGHLPDMSAEQRSRKS